MRKLLAAIVMLFGCLMFTGQSIAAVSASYSECCLHGCKGMAQCTSDACQACAAPQAASVDEPVGVVSQREHAWHRIDMRAPAERARPPWRPPD